MTRAARIGVIIAAVGFAAGLRGQNSIPVGVFHDDGQYVILARSIAEHGTYRFDNLPGAPPGVHYPPAYPLVLAAVWKVAPGNIQAFRLVNALLLGAAAAAIFALARTTFGLGERASIAVSVGVAASAPFVWFNSVLISETLFVAALCATFAFEAHGRDRGVGWQAGAGLLAAFTGLIRSLGDPLGALFVLERVVRRKWRDAGVVAAAWLVVLGPWKLWLRAHGDDMPPAFAGAYGDYTAWWRTAVNDHGVSFIFETMRENIRQLPITLRLLGWDDVLLMEWIVPLLVAAVAILGAVHARRARVVSAYFLMYIAAVIIWPFAPDRFFLVMIPIVAASFAVGAAVIRAAVTPRGKVFVAGAAAVALALIVGVVPTYHMAFVGQPWERGFSDRGRAGMAAARLVEQMPPGARIATDYDELVHIVTGRQLAPVRGLTAAEYVLPPSDSLEGTRLRDLIAAHGITHVVAADIPTLRGVAWLRANGLRLVAVAGDSGGAVVYVRPPTPPPAQ